MEWSKFPSTVQRNILKHCDFTSRFVLRETCDSMKELINQEHFEMDDMEIECKSIFLKVKLGKGDEKYEKTFIVPSGDVEYWKMPLIAEFSSFLGDLKHTLISECIVDITDEAESTEELLLAMNSFRVPPKIGHFYWKGIENREVLMKFLEVFDKRFLMEIDISNLLWTNNMPFEIFAQHFDTLKTLDHVQIGPQCDATDNQMLALTAKWIQLESNNFTAEMIERVIEKSVAEKRIGLSIRLINKMHGLDIFSQIQAPEGFSINFESQTYKSYKLAMENLIIYLTVSTKEVNLRIDPHRSSISPPSSPELERRFRFPRGFQPGF